MATHTKKFIFSYGFSSVFHYNAVNLQIHSKRAWHIHDSFFVGVVCHICTIIHSTHKKKCTFDQKSYKHNPDICSLYLRRMANKSRLVFVCLKAKREHTHTQKTMLTIPFASPRWQFHIQLTEFFFSLVDVFLFNAWIYYYSNCVQNVHCFKRYFVFQSVTTILSWNLWQCYC